jgi:uncharacterized membrane protein YccF (DUF307 family)
LGEGLFCNGEIRILPLWKGSHQQKDVVQDIGTGGLGLVGNIVWFIFAGLWLALGHVASALLCFISIIGIPFGIQHLKLAGIAIAPIGKTVVTKEVATAARKQDAEAALASIRTGT